MKIRPLFFAIVATVIISPLVGCQTIVDRIPTPGQAICAIATAPFSDAQRKAPKPASASMPEARKFPLPPATPSPERTLTPEAPPPRPPAPTPVNAVAKLDDPNVQKELDCMWQRDYQGFEYANALSHLPKVLTNPSASAEQRGTTLIIAAASYFILGDPQSAKNCLRMLLREQSGLRPKATLFPRTFMQMYEEASKTTHRR